MTQERFKTLKKWVEQVTNYDFPEGWAHFDENGAYFSAMLRECTLSLGFNDDESVELILLRDDEDDLSIYKTDERNAHLCTDIFSHMAFNN